MTLAARTALRRYYAVTLVYALAGGFLVGVYPLFLRARGLTQLEINSVLAMYFVMTFLTDVPTGAFADAFGRRGSFVVGCGLRCAAFALYFVSHTYVLFLVAEAIDAVGTTFCNGAVDAWGVDMLDEAGSTVVKDHVFSRIGQLSSLGLMTTSVVGAAAGMVDLAWPWLLGAAGFAVSGCLGPLMRERADHAAHLELKKLASTVGAGIVDGLRQGLRVRAVRLLSLAEGVVLASYAPFWLEWPLLFGDRYGVGVWITGWVFSAFTLASMIGAEVVVRVGAVARHRGTVLGALLVAMGILLGLAGFVAGNPTHALAVLVVMSVLYGAREPLARAWFNAEVRAADRATMLSFRSTLATAGGSLGLILGGFVVDLRGIAFQWQTSGMLLVLAAPCYVALRSRRTSRA